jgi:O-antigen/teichoic acid export membrane protein
MTRQHSGNTTSDRSSLGRLAVRNAVWLTLFSYASQFIAFGATIILTRKLGPQVFGVLALGMFWSSLLNLRTKSGIGQAAIRQPVLDGELLGTLYALDGGLAVGSFALCAIAATVLAKTGHAAEALVVIVSAVVENVTAVIGPLGMALEKELQLSRVTLVSLLSTTCAYGVGIALAYAGGGIWSLLVMNIITNTAAIAAVYGICKRRLPHVFRLPWRFSRPMAKTLLKQGTPVGLANASVTTIVNQFDNMLIGTFVGTTTLGFYDRAYRTSQWPNTLLAASLQRVGFLTFAQVQDDRPRLTHAMRLCLWVLTTLGTPMALAITSGASDLVRILYGPEWNQSAFFLRFLVLYSFFSPFIGLSTSLAYVLGDIRMAVAIPAAQAAAIIIAGLPLTLWRGAMGTILAVGITIALGFGLSCRYIFRQLPLLPGEVFGRPLLAIGVASLVILFVFRLPGWGDLPSPWRLAATVAASAGTYVGSLLALCPSEMIERTRYLIKTFRGARNS